MSILESLFSKSIIAPDTSVPQSKPQPKAVNPSVVDLMREHMNNLERQDLLQTQQSQNADSISDAVTSPTVVPEESPVQKPMLPEYVAPVPTLVENSTLVVSEPVSSAKEVEKDNVGDMEVNETDSSRIFVNKFLGEINSLLVEGKQLEEVLKVKTDKENFLHDSERRTKEMHDRRMEVGRKIADLFGEGESKVTEDKLKMVTEAYEDYLTSFASEIEKVGREARLDVSKANMLLNDKKKKIKEIFGQTGGPENVEKIKSIIRICETAAKKARGLGEYAEIPLKIKEEISGNVARFISDDLEGGKLLVSQGKSIIDVMIAIYKGEVK